MSFKQALMWETRKDSAMRVRQTDARSQHDAPSNNCHQIHHPSSTILHLHYSSPPRLRDSNRLSFTNPSPNMAGILAPPTYEEACNQPGENRAELTRRLIQELTRVTSKIDQTFDSVRSSLFLVGNKHHQGESDSTLETLRSKWLELQKVIMV